MQEPLAVGHVVVVARLDRFPGVPGWVGCRKTEHPGQPGAPVGPVVGQRLAGPLARHQDAPPGVAEVLAAVGLALAGPRLQARPGVAWLDAVAEPVRAGRRARFVPQRVGEPGGMAGLGASGGLVAVAEVLGQVLGEVADAPAGIPGSGQDALGVEAGAEPGYVPRLVLVGDGVEGLVPVRQDLAGVRVEVGARVLIPDRQVPAVVLDGLGWWPPDLVVGGGDDLAELLPGDGAADGEVDVRGEAALWFDGGEVLQVIAGVAAQVLDEPVEQGGEVQCVAGGTGVVVGVRVGGCSVLADPAVRRTGQRDEQRGPEGLAVRRGVGLADGPGADRAAGQGSGILAAPGGAVAARPRRQDLATKPGIGDRLVKLVDPIIQLSRIEAFAGQEVPVFLRLGPVSDCRRSFRVAWRRHRW